MTDSEASPPAVSATAEPKASETIAKLARDTAGTDVSLAAIAEALKERGFGILMILFALPNAVIPGLSFILGAPVLLFALQLAARREEVWLPGFLARRTLPGPLFQKAAARAEAFLVWVEKRLRPRWRWLVSRQAERWLGLYIAIAAAFLMTPIPFGNTLPALGISFIAAGLIERDGKAVFLGILLGALGIAYISLAVVLGFNAVRTLSGLF